MDIACPCQVLYMFADLSFVLFLQEWQTLFTMLPEHEVSRGNLLATLPKLGRQWKVESIKRQLLCIAVLWFQGELGLSSLCSWSSWLDRNVFGFPNVDWRGLERLWRQDCLYTSYLSNQPRALFASQWRFKLSGTGTHCLPSCWWMVEHWSRQPVGKRRVCLQRDDQRSGQTFHKELGSVRILGCIGVCRRSVVSSATFPHQGAHHSNHNGIDLKPTYFQFNCYLIFLQPALMATYILTFNLNIVCDLSSTTMNVALYL